MLKKTLMMKNDEDSNEDYICDECIKNGFCAIRKQKKSCLSL